MDNVDDIQALAQDQKQAFENLLYACEGLEKVRVCTYDGDTPQEERRRKFYQNTQYVRTLIRLQEYVIKRLLS